MKYLWIGVGYAPEQEKCILARGGKLMSGVVSNNSLIGGLDACGVECDSINCPCLEAYPAYPEKHVAEASWSRYGGTADFSIGFYNGKYVRSYFQQKAMVKAAEKWAKANRGEDATVFVYGMASRFLAAAVRIKQLLGNVRIVLITPDLPQFMDMQMSPLKKILKWIDWRQIRRLLAHVDKFVLYSCHMADFLGLKEGSYLVMEGSYDPATLVEDIVDKSREKIVVMYSGVLGLRYGIRELLDAFELLDSHYELWLTGGGNAVPLIEERAQRDSRIKYLGYLPSRRDLLRKQKQASVLISTRSTEEEASKYCFPSKIFEYMISGNPVISTRICGIPDEYFDYLIPIDKLNAPSIAEAIRRVDDMKEDERAHLGEQGKMFVLSNKSNVAQVKNILNCINE